MLFAWQSVFLNNEIFARLRQLIAKKDDDALKVRQAEDKANSLQAQLEEQQTAFDSLNKDHGILNSKYDAVKEKANKLQSELKGKEKEF